MSALSPVVPAQAGTQDHRPLDCEERRALWSWVPALRALRSLRPGRQNPRSACNLRRSRSTVFTCQTANQLVSSPRKRPPSLKLRRAREQVRHSLGDGGRGPSNHRKSSDYWVPARARCARLAGTTASVCVAIPLKPFNLSSHPTPFLCAARFHRASHLLLPTPVKGWAERREARISKSRLRGAIVHAYEARRAPDLGPAALASRRSNLALRVPRFRLASVRTSYLSPATATGQNLALLAHPVVTSGRRTPASSGRPSRLSRAPSPLRLQDRL